MVALPKHTKLNGGTMTELLLLIITALLAGIAYFIKQIFNKTSSLEAGFQPITPAIVEIQGKFTDAGHNILFPLTVTPGSPLKVTEYGKKLLDESGFYAILKKHKKELVNSVKLKDPKTNYDIQQCSTALIQDLLDRDSDIVRPLKDYAYNNGLSVKLIVPPAGIALRDEVMKELKV